MAAALTPLPQLADGPLRMRPWCVQDVEGLVEAARESVGSVGRWLPWCRAGYGTEEARDWVEHCQRGWACGEHFAFAIHDAHTGILLGGVGLNQRNRLHRSANLGYWVRESRQGHGIAACAAAQVARFGFEQLELVRIEIVALPQNTASRRTAEKLGARFEAVARQRLWVGDKARDAAVYALIPADLGL